MLTSVLVFRGEDVPANLQICDDDAEGGVGVHNADAAVVANRCLVAAGVDSVRGRASSVGAPNKRHAL